MIITQAHVAYWQAKKANPRFSALVNRRGLSRVPSGTELIDGCVNAHVAKPAGFSQMWQFRFDSHNTLNLCRSVVRRGEDILVYLDRLAIDPRTVINPHRRSGYARKWAKRLRRQRLLNLSREQAREYIRGLKVGERVVETSRSCMYGSKGTVYISDKPGPTFGSLCVLWDNRNWQEGRGRMGTAVTAGTRRISDMAK